VAIGLVVIVGGLLVLANRPSDPDKLFQLAMTNMLATRSYTQTSVSGTDVVTIKADVNDIKQPRVAAAYDLRSSNVSVSGYAGNGQSLIRFNSYDIKNAGVNIAPIKGKWVQLKKNGQADDSGANGLGFAGLFDPPTAILGRFIIANVATSSRNSLVETIKNTGVYSYDAKKVSSTDVNGQSARRYNVTVKNSALRNLNQKVAELAGISQEQADDIVDSKAGKGDATVAVYIGTDSQRIIKIESTTDTTSVTTTTFSNYDTTQPGAAPVAEVLSTNHLLDR
jgi:hypothetical protein